MKVIRPVTVTESLLTTTNVTEVEQAEWATATAYVLDDLVQVAVAGDAASVTHKIYKAVGATTGNDPTTDDGTYWTEISSTNRYKMFDTYISDQTVQASNIDVTITPVGAINSVGGVNVVANTVQIIVTDALEGEVYNVTHNLVSDSGIQDWYAYFFAAIELDTEFSDFDMPSYVGATVQVVLTVDSGDTSIGALIVGQKAAIGDSQYGAEYGIIDYSTKTVDAQGRFTITEGAYARTADVQVVINAGQSGTAQNVMNSLLNVPTLWVADEDVGGTTVYGYYREYSVLYSNNAYSLLNIEIEGLT